MTNQVFDIQQERLFYLEFLAVFTGQVSRKDLVKRFGISEPAATKDLTRYAELVPQMLNYNMRKKVYQIGIGTPLFNHDVEQSLYALAGDRAIALDTEHAKRIPGWVDCNIKRSLPLTLAATLTRCIFQHQSIVATYASNSSGTRERSLSPVALINDGLRWHVRCFDHESKEFRDYNLARFKDVRPTTPSQVSLVDDKEWNTDVQLELIPHPKAKHPDTIQLDYDIAGDAKLVTLKSCLVGYFLRRWHIDSSEEASGNPNAQHLFLRNRKELVGHGLC